MEKLVQILVSGLLEGSVYALIALGFNLVFSTTRIVNFAQGTLFVIAGYTAYVLADTSRGGLNIWLTLAIVIVFSVLVGLLTEVLTLGFLYQSATLVNVMTALALAFGIYMATQVDSNVLRVFYVVLFPLMLRGFVKAATHRPITQLDPNHNVGWIITTFSANILALEVVRKSIDAEPHALPKLIGSVFGWRGSQIAGVPIGPLEISVIGAALLMALLLETFLDKTTVGRAFRAVAQDKQTASLMGINPAVMVALSFAIAGALATVAVFTIGGQRNISLTDGTTYAIYAFMAAVVGGLGSTRGALVGGLLLGLVSWTPRVLSASTASYAELVVFGVFLLVLVLRPQGLFGQPIVEKV